MTLLMCEQLLRITRVCEINILVFLHVTILKKCLYLYLLLFSEYLNNEMLVSLMFLCNLNLELFSLSKNIFIF